MKMGKRLCEYVNHRRIKYKPTLFATEEQFDEISKHLKDEYEPKIVYAHEIASDSHDVVILSNLRLIEVDDEDMEYIEGYIDSYDMGRDDDEDYRWNMTQEDLDNTEMTFYTNPIVTDKGYKEGKITNIPAMAKVCTIVKKDLDIFKDKVGSNGYLSADEYNFLMT